MWSPAWPMMARTRGRPHRAAPTAPKFFAVYADAAIHRLEDLHRAFFHETPRGRCREKVISDRNLNKHSHDSEPFLPKAESLITCRRPGFLPRATHRLSDGRFLAHPRR